MIKRIIFDLDDTLIPFPKNFIEGYKEVLDNFNLSITPIELYKLIGEYEPLYDHYDYDLLINFVNDRLGTNFDRTFLDKFMEVYDNLDLELNEGVRETLEYLSKKYSVVALTNWFTKSQKNRLKKLGILKYFDEVYGGDYKSKPHKEAFIHAAGDCKIEECVVVGDSIEMDIKPATKLGIKAYLYGSDDKYECIDKISDLMEVL